MDTIGKKELVELLGSVLEKIGTRQGVQALLDDPERTLKFRVMARTLGKVCAVINISEIKEIDTGHDPFIIMIPKQLTLVAIRPVSNNNKITYLGFLLGDMATGCGMKITDEKVKSTLSGYNPAIFVPELNKIVFGYESWWSEIESEEDFKQITDKDINDVWYVKLWRQTHGSQN